MRDADLVGIWLGGLDGTTWWEQDADEPAYAASLMKLPIAIAAERRHQRGELDLDAEVAGPRRLRLGARRALATCSTATTTRTTRPGTASARTRPCASCAAARSCASGNLATNLLLEHVGLPEVPPCSPTPASATARRITRGIGDLPARDAGLSNVVTARDLGRLLLAHAARGRGGACAARPTATASRPACPPAPPSPTRPAGSTASPTTWRSCARPTATPFVLVVLTRLAGVSYDDANERIAALAAEAWERRR